MQTTKQEQSIKWAWICYLKQVSSKMYGRGIIVLISKADDWTNLGPEGFANHKNWKSYVGKSGVNFTNQSMPL